MFEGCDCEGELSHWVEIVRAAVDELGDELGDVGAGGQFGGQLSNLLLAWDFSSQEKPEEAYSLSTINLEEGLMCWLTFWQRLRASGSLRQQVSAFWYGLATESNAFLRVEDRSFPD